MNFLYTNDDYNQYTKNQLYLLDTISFNSSDAYPSLLMKAIVTGNIELAKTLIDKEIRINDKGKNNICAITLSAHMGHLELIKLLHEKGVDVNEVGEHDHTPLSLAAKHGYQNIVEYLIENGANINHVTKNHSTPLIYAALYNNYECFELLLKAGANVNDVNKDNASALTYASMYNHRKIVNLLLGEDDINVDQVNNDNYTPLLYASKNGNRYIVRKLLKKGANIDHKAGVLFSKYNATCLANKCGHTKVVELLNDVKMKNRTDDDETTDKNIISGLVRRISRDKISTT